MQEGEVETQPTPTELYTDHSDPINLDVSGRSPYDMTTELQNSAENTPDIEAEGAKSTDKDAVRTVKPDNVQRQTSMSKRDQKKSGRAGKLAQMTGVDGIGIKLHQRFQYSLVIVFETHVKSDMKLEPCCRIPLCTSPKSVGTGMSPCYGQCAYKLEIDYEGGGVYSEEHDDKEDRGQPRGTINAKYENDVDCSDDMRAKLRNRDHPENLLKRLVNFGLDYKLGYSRDGHLIFCLISISEKSAKMWASIRDVDLLIEPEICVRYGRMNHINFPLAKRTHPDVGRTEKVVEGWDGETEPLLGSNEDGLDKSGSGDGGEISPHSSLQSAQEKAQKAKEAAKWLFSHVAQIASDTLPNDRLYEIQRTKWAEVKDDVKGAQLMDKMDKFDSNMFGLDVWKYLYASYNQHVDEDVYKHYDEYSGSIFQPAMRLRLLYELITDDAAEYRDTEEEQDKEAEEPTENTRIQHGAGISLEKLKSNGDHPLWNFFPLNHVDDEKWEQVRSLMETSSGMCTCEFWKNRGTLIFSTHTTYILREYFGERIAFYFAFLLHLFDFSILVVVVMIPLMVWNANCGSSTDVPDNKRFYTDECSQVSTLTMLWILVWSVLLVEYWKRKQSRLVVKWGMINHSQRNVVWDLHEGLAVVSPMDGYLEKIHESEFWHVAQFIPIVIFIMIFIALMCFLYQLIEFMYRDAAGSGVMDATAAFLMGTAFMLINEIVIAIYEELDIALTECENHRFFEDFEKSLVIKRMAFYAINSLMVLIWFGYAKIYLLPQQYLSNDAVIDWGLTECWEKSDAEAGLTAILETSPRSLCVFDEISAAIKRTGKTKTEPTRTYEQVYGAETLEHHIHMAAATELNVFAFAWLLNRVWLQNICEWFFPRFFGFLCARGLHPCVLCDFFYDLCCIQCSSSSSQDVENEDEGFVRDEQGCYDLCCDDGSLKPRIIMRTEGFPNKQIPPGLIQSCEMQCDRQTYFKCLDNTVELCYNFLYTNIFVMAFPAAPLLFAANLVIEFNADLYRLFDRRRPVPVAADGLAEIWAGIFDSIIYMSIVVNMIWVSYHTNLVKQFFAEDTPINRLFFFTMGTACIGLVLMLIQFIIPDIPGDVKDHLSRQDKVEARLVSHACTEEYIATCVENKEKIRGIRKTFHTKNHIKHTKVKYSGVYYKMHEECEMCQADDWRKGGKAKRHSDHVKGLSQEDAKQEDVADLTKRPERL